MRIIMSPKDWYGLLPASGYAGSVLLTGSLNHRFLYVYHDERSRVVFFFFISLCEYISFAFCKNDFNRSGDLALCSGVIVFFWTLTRLLFLWTLVDRFYYFLKKPVSSSMENGIYFILDKMQSPILIRWLSTILTLPDCRIFISIRFPTMSIKIDLNQFQIYHLETLSFFFFKNFLISFSFGIQETNYMQKNISFAEKKEYRLGSVKISELLDSTCKTQYDQGVMKLKQSDNCNRHNLHGSTLLYSFYFYRKHMRRSRESFSGEWNVGGKLLAMFARALQRACRAMRHYRTTNAMKWENWFSRVMSIRLYDCPPAPARRFLFVAEPRHFLPCSLVFCHLHALL